MATDEHKTTLYHRIMTQGGVTAEPSNGLVPLDEYALFTMAAAQMVRSVLATKPGQLTLIVDSRTAEKIEVAVQAAKQATQSIVFGSLPSTWSEIPNVRVITEAPHVGPLDRFLVVVSEALCLGCVGERSSDTKGKSTVFLGFWTAMSDYVRALADQLLAPVAPERMHDLPLPAEPTGETLTCVMRLSALLVGQLASRQRDMAMDKDDLVSVLDILKAISANRRAHDILYVFVEQIARVVQMDRCSVVRVWGHEDRGHVLASHEDRRVSDIPIELNKYPEVFRALDTGERVVINDVHTDPLTRGFSDQLSAAGIDSILVVPIVLFDQNVGSLLLRAARSQRMFTLREMSFCEIVAEAAANALERAQLFESIQKANERLEYLAVTDGLTNLYNHRYFRERLEDEFERARRYKLPLSCLILDVDHFKQVNDSYGHLVGDSVLREMAERILQLVRKSDIVARYGGEEFVVVMPQTGPDGALTQAERLRELISSQPFIGLPADEKVTISVGVAVLDHENMLDCESLIRVADNALYKSKQEGRNRVTVGGIRGNLT